MPPFRKYTSTVLASVAAVISLQSLFFKFSGAPVSIHLFRTLGAEPFGRIGTGIIELLAAFLLLIPRTRAYGAVVAGGVMLVAIISHFFILGIEVENDGGKLFVLACITLLACAWLAFDGRKQLAGTLSFLKK